MTCLVLEKKWDVEYRNKINRINSLNRNSLRYPDVYQNILLFDERIDILKDYKYENAYQRYMSSGWAYSLDEKKQKIEKEKAIIKNDALFCKQVLYDCRDKITNEYAELFEELFKEKQPNLAFYHDYGLLAFMNNNFDKSSELLFALIDHAHETNQIDHLDATIYHDLGSVCIEIMAYDKAIKYLSDAIHLDPSNKETYFQRAIAYFETGQFDLAIDDYLISNKKKTISDSEAPSNDFTKALYTSLCQGVAESVVDFVPSLCSTTYGLGKTLWTTVQTPIESTKAFSRACYEMGKCFVDYCKTVDSNTIDDYIDQLKELYNQFDHLNDNEKGELIGYTIGKYGVDIFAGGFVIGGAIKGGKVLVSGACAYRKLKNVNRACNLEAMVISRANKEALISESLKHAAERENYFKSVRLHWDKQNKHIPGKHNFLHGRGTITIESNEFETLTKKYVGKGQRVEGSFGDAGYVERVDFEKIIGEYAEKVNGEIKYTPTSKGIIKYAKDGTFHVIPSNPEASIK